MTSNWTKSQDRTKGSVERLLLTWHRRRLQSPSAKTRARAARALEAMGPGREVLEGIDTVLESDNVQVRVAAVGLLGRVLPARATPGLIAALWDDTSCDVRQAAASAFGEIGDRDNVRFLVRALDDQDQQVRKAVVEALGKFDTWEAKGPLRKMLGDEDEDVCIAAIEALGQLEEWESITALIQGPSNPPERIQQAVTEVLASGGPSAARWLGHAMRDVEPSVRLRMIDILKQIGGQSAVPELFMAARDEDADVRETATRALLRMGSDAVPELIKALSDWKTEDVRLQAVKLLGQIHDESATPGLQKALADNAGPVRRAALAALDARHWQPTEGKNDLVYWLVKQQYDLFDESREDLVEPLVDLFERFDAEGCASVAEALVQIGPGAVPMLVEKVWGRGSHSAIERREKALEILGRIGDRSVLPLLVDMLEDEFWSVRCAAAEALGWIGDASAVPALLKAIEDKNRNVRRVTLLALAVLCADAVPEIVDALESGSQELRSVWATVLGFSDDANAVLALVPLLADEDYAVRESAVTALARIGRAAVPDVLDALAEGNATVRQTAAKILGHIRDRSAVSELQIALEDDDEDVRLSVTWALGEIGDISSIGGLRSVLNDDYWAVREGAAVALGKIGSPEALPELMAAVEQAGFGDLQLQKAAVTALGWIGDPAASPAIAMTLMDDSSLGKAGMRALEKLPDELVTEHLQTALSSHGNWRVRAQIALLAGMTRDAAFENELLAALSDEVAEVRGAAAFALGRIGGEDVWEHLIAVMRDPEPVARMGALGVLWHVGGPKAIDALLQAAQDEDEEVRELAEASLTDMGYMVVPRLIPMLQDKSLETRSMGARLLQRIWAEALVHSQSAAIKRKESGAEWQLLRSDAFRTDVIEAHELDTIAEQPGIDGSEYAAPDAAWQSSDSTSAAELVQILEGSEPARRMASAELVRMGTEAVPSLLRSLVRRRGLSVRGRLDERKLMIGHSDVTVRQNATRVLGLIREGAAIVGLVLGLLDEDWRVRWQAAEGLKHMWDSESLDQLIEALGHEDNLVRGAACEALGFVGTSSIVDPLLEAMKDESRWVAWTAARALSSIGAEAVPGLLDAAKEVRSDSQLFYRVTEAIKHVDDSTALEPLLRVLTGEQWYEHQALAESLETRTLWPSVPGLQASLLDDDWDIRWAISEALAKIGADAVPGLSAALQHPHPGVRRAAASTLAKIGDVSAIQLLVPLLQDEDPSARKEVANALDKLDWRPAADALGAAYWAAKGCYERSSAVGPGAVDVLARTCRNCEDEDRIVVAKALADIGVPATNALHKLVEDDNWRVGKAAEWALKRIERCEDEAGTDAE